MISHLCAGRKLTLIFIDELLAWTHRKQIEIKSTYSTPREVTSSCGTKKVRLGTYCERGKRQEFSLDLAPDTLVFDGWEVPFKADTDDGAGNVFQGNACFNLVGDPAVIRDWVETKQLNSKVSEQDRGKILVWPQERSSDTEPQLLYPEIRTSHHVIAQLKEKRAH
jgi:hypothetical protein